jgi:hypothetical protein
MPNGCSGFDERLTPCIAGFPTSLLSLHELPKKAHSLPGKSGKSGLTYTLLLTNHRTRFIFRIIEYGKRLRTGLVQPEAEFRESGKV